MRTASALLVVLALSLTLTGCVPDDDPITVDPEPSTSPIFESDEEALAAAEEAYGAYLSASDLVSASGGADVALLEAHVTEEYLSALSEEFTQFSTLGRRTSGATRFDSFELQQHAETSGQASVTVYLCLDVSNVAVLDESGTDVTPIDRQLRLPLEVAMTTTGSSDTLLIDGSTLWDGADYCV